MHLSAILLIIFISTTKKLAQTNISKLSHAASFTLLPEQAQFTMNLSNNIYMHS